MWTVFWTIQTNLRAFDFCQAKAQAKRSQHFNAAYRHIVGRNMLRAFGHHVAMCCDMLGVVGSSLKMVKLVDVAWCCTRLARFVQQCCARACAPVRFATLNMSQKGGQTRAACCTQQCCDMLRWNVAIVWPGLITFTKPWVFWLLPIFFTWVFLTLFAYVSEFSLTILETRRSAFVQLSLNWLWRVFNLTIGSVVFLHRALWELCRH